MPGSQERTKRFCLNCGEQIPAPARFCPYCGTQVEIEKPTPAPVPVPPSGPEVVRNFGNGDSHDVTYKMLEPGQDFNGYRIIRLLNKDPEGIKYIAEKDGKEYVLKLFFNVEFTNLDSLIGLQIRLKRLNKLETSHTARVAEVNQNHVPAYMASEFVRGESLAQIKAKDPGRLTEEYVRDIGRRLIHTAMAVRDHGLTLHKLTPSGIMMQSGDRMTVLSSGISYEEIDERDEVFNIGVIMAQLLSKNVLYKSIYNTQRLREQKFSYIPGTTIALNRIMANCLHRNILQRFVSLESLLRSLNSLPPVNGDEVFVAPESSQTLADIHDVKLAKVPQSKLVWVVYAVSGLILLALAYFYFFILPKMNDDNAPGGLTELFRNGLEDSTGVRPATDLSARQPRSGQEGVVAETLPRTDPRRQSLASNQDYSTPAPAVKPKTPIPANFVRVPDGSFGFNRLKDNPNHNVSQDGFYISRNEVSQAEWNLYMMPADVSYAGDKLPVDNVSWLRIIRYCNARSENEGLQPAYKITGSSASSVTCDFSANGYRLPTESEWEMAAKAGELYAYSGSDDPDAVAWYRDNSGGRVRSGGGKSANAYGLHDMSGNVAEWCWDWYDAKYPTTLSTFINPSGPAGGTLKIIRGGSVRNGLGTNLGILYRDKGDPARGYQYVGFRLVRKR